MGNNGDINSVQRPHIPLADGWEKDRQLEEGEGEDVEDEKLEEKSSLEGTKMRLIMRDNNNYEMQLKKAWKGP